ncbi:hypothetical protein MGG_15642 [Pyricularia oryzae 70-15]|uniref:Uncharacterized protein n=3 Tax=Pyricularia oryzae TaxID=318829 RepID=G4MX11_PYRO7|nr:uncharacterized protein MGG_15642 [Pyricularia oryzae 70-15]EHA54303.1 hypothetical protein MGG_15642 [Pyricularia oryzae 70-15]ELQ43022.1 hypothetical protein OOU_Y34scaffold00177g34 [Pyricularia oryzae Y34]
MSIRVPGKDGQPSIPQHTTVQIDQLGIEIGQRRYPQVQYQGPSLRQLSIPER